MNYLSVCSGIEAATCAWHDMGWNPVGFSEIEPFPSAVLKHHYPTVPNLGDMTKYKEWKLNGSIDILVGGTPCQSFSVAGLRKGLEDPRGNLALTYCGILDHFRPKWFVWENVPGVLSSNGGRDFGAFLGALAELGYGFAYRVLDAQHFGVAQRRRRVFVVGCLGDWRSAAEVLFESESLRRDIKPRRTQRKSITGYVESSFGQYREDVIAGTTKASGGVLSGGSETFITTVGTLDTECGSSKLSHQSCVAGHILPVVQQAFRKGRRAQSTEDYETWVDDGKANTINTFDLGDIRTTHAVAYPIHPQALLYEGGGKTRNNDGKGNGLGVGENGEPMNTLTTVDRHMVAHAYSFDSLSSNSMKSSNPVSGCNEVQLSKTLDTSCLNPTANQGGIAVAYSLREDAKANTFSATELEVSNAISALRPSPQSHHAQVFVAQPLVLEDQGGSVMNTSQTGIVGTLRSESHGHEPSILAHTFKVRGGCEGGGKGYLGQDEKAFTISTTQDQQLYANMAVRRLTPMECERLQGFPDGYTNIKENCPDGPRYKALGNSMAVPVMRWIGERINLINKAQEK